MLCITTQEEKTKELTVNYTLCPILDYLKVNFFWLLARLMLMLKLKIRGKYSFHTPFYIHLKLFISTWISEYEFFSLPPKILKIKCDDTEVVRAAPEPRQGQSPWHQHGMVQLPVPQLLSLTSHIRMYHSWPKTPILWGRSTWGTRKNGIQEVQKFCWAPNQSRCALKRA